RKLQRDGIEPRWPGRRCSLLVEELAVDAVGIADEHVRPAAGAAQRAFRDRQVVAGQIELGMASGREEYLLGIRDRHLAFPNGQNLVRFALGHQTRRNARILASSASSSCTNTRD